MNAVAQTMTSATTDTFTRSQSKSISAARLWTGRILTGAASLFFLLDGVMKLAKPAFVVQATLQLGYPETSIVGIGAGLVLCTALYLIPRTAVIGAILLTGYLGGAVATHLRVSAPTFNIVFPVLFGMLVWTGLYLRDQRLQKLFQS
ncbi:MAG TPA: DoxX family protein [Acidobacteriaceae bacterium]|nr:DoxX family protein [Acidobacteriaceae bacterium]